MTAITQKIRRFTGGISDQPDEQKIPGQVRDAVNCIPDVVQGLVKRPGMNLVNELDTDKEGKWFFIDKENNFNDGDRYVGKIDHRTYLPNPDFDPDQEESDTNKRNIDNPNRGKVRVWELGSGMEQQVCYTSVIDPLDIDPTAAGIEIRKKPLDNDGNCIIDNKTYVNKYPCTYYCEGLSDDDTREPYFYEYADTEDDLQVLTINDYTFVTNRKRTVAMSSNDEEKKPPQATVELRSIAGLTTYKVCYKLLPPPRDEDNVSRVTVSVTGLQDDPPTCSSDFVQTFRNQSGNRSGTGLDFRLQTTSVVDGGSCVYSHNVTILNGGTGWEVGETVTVNNGGVTYTITVSEINQDIAVSRVTKMSAVGVGFDTSSTPGGIVSALQPCTQGTDTLLSNMSSTNPGSFGEGLSVQVKTTGIRVPINPIPPGRSAGFSDPRVRNPNFFATRCQYSTTVVVKNGGTGWKVGDTFSQIVDGINYQFRVDETANTAVEVEEECVSAQTDRENPQSEKLLDDLTSGLESKGFTVERIGNSLYLTRDQPFTITTPNSILLRVLSSTNVGTSSEPNYVVQANDISEVPLQTKHELVFQIRNSFSDADDYYVQFQGDNDTDGTGTYKEVAKPGIQNEFMPGTMPHGILRLAGTEQDDDGNIIRTFLVTSFKWAPRSAGDDLTVPRPSFAPEEGGSFGRMINQLAFFRNRFVMLTDENVVCSVAGDFFNFWAKTAQSITPSDPIDLQVSNNYPSVLYGAQPTTAGLILFSENAQFMLGTENDVLEPRTARTSILSTYNYNRNSNPISLGTTVGFVSGIGRYTRFYEMANISRDQEPEVVEQSKVVERLIPGGFQYVGISKDNQLAAFGKPYSDDVWVFRYFNTGERRAQSAWVRWKLPGELVNHALINDSYFTVVDRDDQVYLLRGDVRALQSTIMLDDESGEEYRTFLDYATAGEAGDVESYTRTTSIIDPSDIDFPVFNSSKDNIFVVLYEGQTDQGLILKCTVTDDGKIEVPTRLDRVLQGSLDDPQTIGPQKFFIGYSFDMSIELPQFYVKREQNGQTDSWDTANVIVQRVKLNFGRIGYYETTLKRLGRDDYTQIYEAKPMDIYDANELGYLPDYEQTTPIYQRNTAFRMQISSNHPAPAVLYSATWEGQYQENYVKRL